MKSGVLPKNRALLDELVLFFDLPRVLVFFASHESAVSHVVEACLRRRKRVPEHFSIYELWRRPRRNERTAKAFSVAYSYATFAASDDPYDIYFK